MTYTASYHKKYKLEKSIIIPRGKITKEKNSLAKTSVPPRCVPIRDKKNHSSFLISSCVLKCTSRRPHQIKYSFISDFILSYSDHG